MKKLAIIGLILFCLFVGCSSDKGSSSNSDDNLEDEKISLLDTLVVEDISELPPCDDSKEGNAMFVQGDNFPYFCIKGVWRNVSDSTDFSVTCTDGFLQGTKKIFSENQNFSDSLKPTGFVFAINGIAEKGPFIFGSSVLIKEIDGFFGHEMKEIANGCIISNNGEFQLENVPSDSNCVKVKVTGYYFNEVTGKASNAPITLAARVCNPSKVNVNVLTHLKIPRLDQLSMNHMEKDVANAQAEKEVLLAFGIDAVKDNLHFEDLSIFGESEYSAALLAISIMLQGDRNENEMMNLINNLAEDLKGDGVWNDPNWKIKIADWIVSVDSANKYSEIRNNVSKYSSLPVPNFEKYIQNFFPMVYGFEACTESNAGLVTFVNQGQSKYFANDYEHADHSKVRFICDEKTLRWRVANDMEKDTVGFGTAQYEKEIREGRVNHDVYYIYDENSWRIATPDEIDGFTDIVEVYANLKPTEKVVFIIRHSERTSDTGEKGHLTDNGKKYAQELGAKFSAIAQEDFYYGYSGFTRTKETCENIAKGKNQTEYSLDILPGLDGNWYVKDEEKADEYSETYGGWEVFSKYAFTGAFSDAFYDLETRSEELIQNEILANISTMKRVNILCTHDFLVVPLLAYVTNGRANIRYYERKKWVNYMAGVAMIISENGEIRYVPVRGLDKGTM